MGRAFEGCDTVRTHKGIPISNLYYMLAYAFEFIDESEFVDVGAEEFDNALDLLAFLLGSGMSRQVKQGLYKEYVPKAEELGLLRGKIDLLGTMRNKVAKRQTVSCEYDELSENNYLNQILKATCFLLIKSDFVDRERRDSLKKTMLYFSEVDLVSLSFVRWESIRFTRGNASYRFLVSLCQLIATGMLVTDADGGVTLAPYIGEDALHRLYERFVLRYFMVHYPELRPSAPKIAWALDEEYTGTMLPAMRADIAISYENRYLIIDTKFYSSTLQNQVRYDSRTVHSGNLYQIFAYVKNKASNSSDLDVLGLLLYARTQAATQPDERFVMDGNEIYVKTLDLAQEFLGISDQLNAIADLVKQRDSKSE